MALKRARFRVLANGRAALVWLLAALSLATFAWAASSADAGQAFFCQGALVDAHGNCYGSDHTLTGVVATDEIGQNNVCAASHYNGALFASYACGLGSAEHCYSATHLLKPLIHNKENYNQYMHGYATWTNTVCP
jgi:hypothetical protein